MFGANHIWILGNGDKGTLRGVQVAFASILSILIFNTLRTQLQYRVKGSKPSGLSKEKEPLLLRPHHHAACTLKLLHLFASNTETPSGRAPNGDTAATAITVPSQGEKLIPGSYEGIEWTRLRRLRASRIYAISIGLRSTATVLWNCHQHQCSPVASSQLGQQ